MYRFHHKIILKKNTKYLKHLVAACTSVSFKSSFKIRIKTKINRSRNTTQLNLDQTKKSPKLIELTYL